MGAIRRVGLGGGWRAGAAGETDRRHWTGERSIEVLQYLPTDRKHSKWVACRETYSILNDNEFI
jgi:hypothetical protein